MRSLSKLFLTLTLVAPALLITAPASAQNTRIEAIEKSQALFESALDLADEVQSRCGCQNTAATLRKIADAATEVEIEARFGTRAEAAVKMKDVIRALRELRRYLPHVPDSRLKLEIKREILIAVNGAGQAVMGNQWVTVYAAPGPGGEDAALDAQLNGVEQNLNIDVTSDF